MVIVVKRIFSMCCNYDTGNRSIGQSVISKEQGRCAISDSARAKRPSVKIHRLFGLQKTKIETYNVEWTEVVEGDSGGACYFLSGRYIYVLFFASTAAGMARVYMYVFLLFSSLFAIR